MKRFFKCLVILLVCLLVIPVYVGKAEPTKDITPPVIEITTPQDNSETKESKIQVKGRVIDPESGIVALNIVGSVANIVEAEGSFSFDWMLAKSKNTVEIVAMNGAGLKTSKTITVFSKIPIDITPPIIEIFSPVDNSETFEILILVQGKISDPESGVSNIKIIGNTANRKEQNGLFDFQWILSLDKNTVDIEVTNGAGLITKKTLTVYRKPPDIVGPKTVLELWIGKKTSLVDGVSFSLDVPPQIAKGRTVVPVRFIAEAFRYKVDYESLSRSINISYGTTLVYLQIDNTEAMVSLIEDGKKKIKFVLLETPPFIQKGRTLVPVRFVAEAFGARVDWNSKEQKITITLKK